MNRLDLVTRMVSSLRGKNFSDAPYEPTDPDPDDD